jgi:molybdopterin-guanine dinucleotide biosynthesis protein A
LSSQPGELNLILACDMPGIEADFLSALLSEAAKTSGLCVAAKDGSGVVHPLCAVYRNGCLPYVQDALAAGRLRLLDLLQDLKARSFETGTILSNINTPQDWRAWQEHQPV